MMRRNILLCLGVGAGLSCSADTGQCLVGSDCPSGACRSDGTCAPVDDSSTSDDPVATDTQAPTPGPTTTGMPTPSSSGTSSSSSDDASGSSSGEPLDADCMPPNGDGVIESTELFFDPGLQANFLAARDVTFDTAGASMDGSTSWDFSVSFPSDATTSAEFLPLAEQWFEPLFPEATHAARLSEDNDLLGVFAATDSALTLHGVVSPDDGPTRTELTYDPPATVLSFPLFEGQTWQSESSVTGLALGVVSFYSEQYESSINNSGTVITPFGSFEALRVGTVVTRTVAAIPTVVRSYAFVAECVGTVASVRSMDNEASEEFTQASELRRLDP